MDNDQLAGLFIILSCVLTAISMAILSNEM
jgi:hypothetical protein